MAGHLVELVLAANGSLSGSVLSGDYAGRDLDELRLPDLLALLVEARELPDQVDASLIEAYLDAVHPDWRSGLEPEADTLREDRELLGLPEGADASQIKLAHRRLMGKVHPDVGGTAALAARVNLARDRLLAALTAEAEAAAE